ncbi:amino acid-binding ACT domain protein [Corynebacterium bovis]|uniref:amino acid-binding ACT domain protein n=1 Tax=Corynebacterium bovis TaxID=36808 RepID=UPI00313A101C
MAYLMRVRLPDVPGTLGRLAAGLGAIDGDIRSVDVVDHSESGVVVDDIVVDLPSGRLADALITAAQEVEGVLVDSLRPFSGTVDRRGQVGMLADVAGRRRDPAVSLAGMMDSLPRTMTAGWAVVLQTDPASRRTTRLCASAAAPEDDGRTLNTPPVTEPRILDAETEHWIPESWTVMDSSLAATPIRGTDLTLVIGRPGGPDFLLSEVVHLGHLGTIFGAFFAPA